MMMDTSRNNQGILDLEDSGAQCIDYKSVFELHQLNINSNIVFLTRVVYIILIMIITSLLIKNNHINKIYMITCVTALTVGTTLTYWTDEDT